MKMRVRTIGILVALFSCSSVLHAGDSIDADEGFVQKNSTINESFIRSIAKNRVHGGSADAVFVEIDGIDEFRDSMESGEFESNIREGNGINKQYIYRDIKNVKIDDKELRDMEGDMLNLGTEIKSNNQQVVQVLNISDSDIRSNMSQINAGVVVNIDDDMDIQAPDLSGIVNRTNIKNSVLQGVKGDD